jgi:CHAT domain-containing protein/tetratricopeptide (TPR) repeat protein
VASSLRPYAISRGSAGSNSSNELHKEASSSVAHMPISNSHNALPLPQGQRTKVQAPILFSDRFRLNKTLGFFYGLDSFVRMEVPNYITEDRQDRINDIASYNSNLMKSQRDDEDWEDSFAPLAIGMQFKIDLPPTRDGENPLSSHVIMSLSKFGQTGFQRDLEEGIRLGNLVLSSPLSSDDERGTVSLVLGVLLSYRFKFTKDIQHLDSAVKLLNEAINSSPTSSESWRHECIVVQAVLLTTYYCHIRSKETFKPAITAASQAIERFNFDTSTNDSYFALSVCCAVLHGERFFEDPSPLDWIAVLESCIHIIQNERSANISEIFRDDSYRRQTLEKLNLQLSRFHVVIEDLDKYHFPADCDVGSVALVDIVGGAVLSAMWEEYGKRIRKVHPAVALAEILDVNHCISIRYSSKDIDKIQEADSNKPYFYFGLSVVQLRFRMPYNVTFTNPEQETPSDSFRKSQLTPKKARELSTSYKRKYETSKDLEDLERAIDYAEIAFKGAPSNVDIIEDLVYLSHSHNLHLDEGATLSSMAQLNRVIQYSELALANPELTGGRRYPIAGILALSARQVFLLGSPLNDFDKRISLVKAVFDDAHSSDHDRLLIPDVLSYALAMCFKARYQNTGEVKNLDDCVKFSELSITFPRLEKQRKAIALNNHGLILRLRYRRTKAFEDLDRAVEVFEEALICNTQPSFHAGIINNLLLIHLDRYDRSGDPNEISMAIKRGEEALERMAIDNNDWESDSLSSLLLNFATALSLTSDPIKLDKAVDYVLKAVAMDKTLKSGHQAPNIRNDASEILLYRYELQKKDGDLDSAIRLAEEARKLIRDGHPSQGEILLQLGACLSLKDRSEISLQSCVNIYLDAWKCESMLPAKRITAASRAAKFLLEDGQVTKAAQLLEDSIELMPSIDARWTQRTDRQDSTSFCLSIPANAAMVALKAGRNAEHALKLLEIGRARTLGSLVDLRTEVPVSDDPDNLVRAFNLLRIKADAATSLSEESSLREKMRMILGDIRGRPGFETFTFPPTANDYMKLAREGPIVVLTTSELVDPGVAIIVTDSRIYTLPLVKMTHVETTRRLREMSEEIVPHTSPETYSSRNKMMVALLTWLWDTIVQPVFRELDFQKKTTEPLPYIRWIGVGPLAKAPLHVAGKYKVKGTPYTSMDYAISSYAPSLRALLYATERGPKQYLNRRSDARVLVVRMPETEGAEFLQHVEEEADTLKGMALSVSMHTTELDVPTTTEVLKHLPLHNLVHFACHGIIDPEVPSNSHFLLSDGKLTVQQILKTYSAEPDVAFLSACSTAECGDARLVDESIHIASAFLVLGFKQIIGTLWEGSDKACMEISNRFYEKLLGEDEFKWDGSWKAKLALHHAVKELQELQPKHALLWAPFVVFGP